MMVRHGQPQLAMAEVGVRFEDGTGRAVRMACDDQLRWMQEWWAPSLLRSSAGLQYAGSLRWQKAH